jgi:hypothetical protein
MLMVWQQQCLKQRHAFRCIMRAHMLDAAAFLSQRWSILHQIR